MGSGIWVVECTKIKYEKFAVITNKREEVMTLKNRRFREEVSGTKIVGHWKNYGDLSSSEIWWQWSRKPRVQKWAEEP